MRVLFISKQKSDQEAVIEKTIKSRFLTQTAGLYNSTHVTKEQVKSTDAIIIMDEQQRKELIARFPKLILDKKVLSLDMTDIASYTSPELIDMVYDKIDDFDKPNVIDKRDSVNSIFTNIWKN